MDSEMPYFLVWSLCIKRLVHRAVYCIILVLSLVLFMQSLYSLSTKFFIYLLVFMIFIKELTNQILLPGNRAVADRAFSSEWRCVHTNSLCFVSGRDSEGEEQDDGFLG